MLCKAGPSGLKGLNKILIVDGADFILFVLLFVNELIHNDQ